MAIKHIIVLFVETQRKFITERNMLRDRYNFDRHVAGVCFLSIKIVLCSNSED
jgi:hypothetical protein